MAGFLDNWFESQVIAENFTCPVFGSQRRLL